MEVVPPSVDLLGQCRSCLRVRWLATVDYRDEGGTPHGLCRSCAREPEAA